MTFENKLCQLISDEINSSDDMIDTLSDLQASLTGSLYLVLLDLKERGIDYPPEKVCLDIKQLMNKK